ncbi:MAG: YdeI/OmpD-associated family protein [Burkholderiales bacterium]
MAGKQSDAVKRLLNQGDWHEERNKLRSLILDSGLVEEVKWGKLCYTFEGHNVAVNYGLKSYCAIGFFKGSLLTDDKKVLVAPGKHSQAMRQMRFGNLDEIIANEGTIADYIGKAIQVEINGLEVAFAEKDNLSFPDELQERIDNDPALAKAFNDLTPGRQRGYVLHFSEAKQSSTRASRVEKCKAKIMSGKGLNDR